MPNAVHIRDLIVAGGIEDGESYQESKEAKDKLLYNTVALVEYMPNNHLSNFLAHRTLYSNLRTPGNKLRYSIFQAIEYDPFLSYKINLVGQNQQLKLYLYFFNYKTLTNVKIQH